MDIELVITWICNWDCEYCAVDTHNQPAFNLSRKIDSIPQGSNVTLSGGEPGALSRKSILDIIDSLTKKGCILSLNTNGTFLRKYPDLVDRFVSILYHCTEDLDINDEILIGAYEYFIVVTDNNFGRLEAFLNKYPDIVFNIAGASNPIGMNNPILSQKNKYELLKRFSNRMTKESKLRAIIEKDFDAITYL